MNQATQFLGYKLRRVSSQAMATLALEFKPIGLKASEVTILIEIRAEPKITASEVGRKLGIKRANMTPVIAKLTEQGLVNSSAINGRSQGLVLSKKGESVCSKAVDILSNHDKSYFAALTSSEREQLAELLTKIWSSQSS